MRRKITWQRKKNDKVRREEEWETFQIIENTIKLDDGK